MQEAWNTFFSVKDLLVQLSRLVMMNEEASLMSYTDASTKIIGGGINAGTKWSGEINSINSHILSNQATRWEIMDERVELEVYSFILCVKKLCPYLLGTCLQRQTIKSWWSQKRIDWRRGETKRSWIISVGVWDTDTRCLELLSSTDYSEGDSWKTIWFAPRMSSIISQSHDRVSEK